MKEITKICVLWAILWLLLLFGAQKNNKTSLIIWNLFRCYLKKKYSVLKNPTILRFLKKLLLSFWKKAEKLRFFSPWVFSKVLKKHPCSITNLMSLAWRYRWMIGCYINHWSKPEIGKLKLPMLEVILCRLSSSLGLPLTLRRVNC